MDVTKFCESCAKAVEDWYHMQCNCKNKECRCSDST